jgi:ketosteroid isomerase-like protein
MSGLGPNAVLDATRRAADTGRQMSHENAEIFRRVLEHYNETGEPPWELIDPDVVYTIDPPAWLAGTYRGHDGLRFLQDRTAEVYEQFRFEVDELLVAGDSVVSLGGIRVRGALSGAEASQKGASVARLRDGRIVAIRVYFNREEALEAAGLRK